MLEELVYCNLDDGSALILQIHQFLADYSADFRRKFRGNEFGVEFPAESGLKVITFWIILFLANDEFCRNFFADFFASNAKKKKIVAKTCFTNFDVVFYGKKIDDIVSCQKHT